jgi:hypothetical protein
VVAAAAVEALIGSAIVAGAVGSATAAVVVVVVVVVVAAVDVAVDVAAVVADAMDWGKGSPAVEMVASCATEMDAVGVVGAPPTASGRH